MKNLAKKILKVMEETKPLVKDKTNEHFGYKYTSDAAVVGAIRDSLIKNGLVLIPNHKAERRENDVTTLSVDYTLLDSDSGESIVTNFISYGQDKNDKGIFKASTGAEKYYLMKTFLLSTEDDPENSSSATIRKRAPQAESLPQSSQGQNRNLTAEILGKLATMNGGNQVEMENHLRVISTWHDKKTGEEKWLKISDLEKIEAKFPDWIQRIHGNLMKEFSAAGGK